MALATFEEVVGAMLAAIEHIEGSHPREGETARYDPECQQCVDLCGEIQRLVEQR